jgi:septal ring factor EnvC (AmiA/AmiB activator)
MPRPASNGLSIAQLEQMLQSRRSRLTKLQRERTRIARKLDQIDSRIRDLGGSIRGGGTRARNAQSLLSMIESTLKSAGGKAMNVGDIAASVLKRGYKTTSANFRGIVNQTLIKEKQFQQASRGMYQLKK